MKYILIKKITKNNLKNFSVKIPLRKLVVIAGPSGSGKSTLVYDVLYKRSLGQNKNFKIKNLASKIDILEQKVILPKNSNLSLGEFNFQKLKSKLSALKKDELLIVDEPCAGFCKKERKNILKMLKSKTGKGYSIIAVEHTKEIIANADYVIELGPGAGRYGGKLIFEGPILKFRHSNTITAKHVFAAEEKNIKGDFIKKTVTLSKINKNNLKNFSFSFPLKSITCVAGCSGSGKSTLLNTVYRALFKGKNAWKIRIKDIDIRGKAHVRRSFIVPQSPIGEHPSSTLATYAKVWDNIREIFAGRPMAEKLKLSSADFIVNKKILDGTEKFSKNALKILYKEKNIGDVAGMTIDEALEIFKDNPLIVRKLSFLQEAGLGYLVLNQKSGSLSGGEAQRVRIANILSKKLGDRAVYIFDTPSRGLHLKDIPVMMNIFKKIINKNNTILIADNREEVMNSCDYVVNL